MKSPINDRNGNLAAWLDRQIFSANPSVRAHVRPRRPAVDSSVDCYSPVRFCSPASGCGTAHFTARKAALLAIAGVVLPGCGDGLGPVLSDQQKNSGQVPSSCSQAGGVFLLLAATIYVVDLWRLGRGAADPNRSLPSTQPLLYMPILVFGTNAILAYMVSELGATILRLIHPYEGNDSKNRW